MTKLKVRGGGRLHLSFTTLAITIFTLQILNKHGTQRQGR